MKQLKLLILPLSPQMMIKNLKKMKIMKKSQNPPKDMTKEDKTIGVKVQILKKHLPKTKMQNRTLKTLRNPKKKSTPRAKDSTNLQLQK